MSQSSTVLIATAIVLGAALSSSAAAADDVREACQMRLVDSSADTQAASVLALDARHPMAGVDWNVRHWQDHRLWISLDARNEGDASVAVRPEIASPDVEGTPVVAGPVWTLAPHASAVLRLSAYIQDDAKVLTVRLRALAATPAAAVKATIATECSSHSFKPGEMAPPASALLDQALKFYVNTEPDPIANPPQVFEFLRTQASGAQGGVDVAWAMRSLMALLHDDQSLVESPGDPVPAEAPPHPVAESTVDLRPDGVAVVRLRPIDESGDDALARAAAHLHARLAAIAAHRPSGWIVDLRELDGGNPWPVLAALGPLLQGPAIGAFTARGERQEWVVDRGAVRLSGQAPFVDLQLPPEAAADGALAVLIGPRTADGGEAVAVAFKGRPRSRFFGSPTLGAGASTLRDQSLSDGTRLRVVSLRLADRAGAVYRGPLQPDAAADDAAEADRSLRAAVDWLNSRP